MEEYYLVDGYNIIHAWPELNEMKNFSLDHARDKLVEIMANFAAFTGSRIKVVFDAHLVKSGTGGSEIINGVEVLYTEEGETADGLIERQVGEIVKHATAYVVTYDWDEQRIIFGRGAYRITPRELLNLVLKTNQEGQKKYVKNLSTDRYLEDRINGDIRNKLEEMRRKKK